MKKTKCLRPSNVSDKYAVGTIHRLALNSVGNHDQIGTITCLKNSLVEVSYYYKNRDRYYCNVRGVEGNNNLVTVEFICTGGDKSLVMRLKSLSPMEQLASQSEI